MPCPYDACHTGAGVQRYIVLMQDQGNPWSVWHNFYSTRFDITRAFAT